MGKVKGTIRQEEAVDGFRAFQGYEIEEAGQQSSRTAASSAYPRRVKTSH